VKGLEGMGDLCGEGVSGWMEECRRASRRVLGVGRWFNPLDLKEEREGGRRWWSGAVRIGVVGVYGCKEEGVGSRRRGKDVYEKNSSDLGDRSFFPRCSFEDDCLAWTLGKQHSARELTSGLEAGQSFSGAVWLARNTLTFTSS
jgi:hypothetical protein